MNKLIICLVFVLSACGGGSGNPTTPEIIKEPPVKETIFIYNNKDSITLNQIGAAAADGYKHIQITVVYDANERKRVEDCDYSCFYLLDSVIVGDDSECLDCMRMVEVTNYAVELGLTLFVVTNDDLSFSFAESIASEQGLTDIVFMSESLDTLNNSQYNYEKGMIGYTNQELLNIDYVVTDLASCTIKCIASESTDKTNKGFDYAIINHQY